MTMRSFEMDIVNAAKEKLNNKKLRLKDLMEWSTGNVDVQEGETYVFLESMGIHASFKLPEAKKKVSK